jgi:hypothetical protein
VSKGVRAGQGNGSAVTDGAQIVSQITKRSFLQHVGAHGPAHGLVSEITIGTID